MGLWASVLSKAKLRQPQRKFLTELMELLLMVPGAKTFRNLSRYSVYHEKSIERQFNRDCDWAGLNRALIKSMVPDEHEQALIIDASFIGKSGSKSYGLDRYWNGSASRSERGLEISTVAWLDVDAQQAYSLSVQQTAATDAGQVVQENRLDQYIQQVRHVVSEQKLQSLRYLITDGYYSKKRFVDAAVELTLDQIGKLRADANMRYLYQGEHKLRRGRRKVYDGKVDWSDLSRFTEQASGEDQVKLYQCRLHHKQFKRVLNVVVVVVEKRGQPRRQAILFSTDLNLSAQNIYRLYRARFHIEFLFRDAKQFCGLNDCQARSKEKLDFHFNASLCAVNIAKLEARVQNGQSQNKQPISMASLQRRAFNRHLIDRIIDHLEPEAKLHKFTPAYQTLCNYGTITQIAA